ncbi:MAG TPA: ATP phosphoribosyltransferase regulatory subunit, partial [Candidatus Acidoferrales bacterium]|nr:ATP phosphoribosyltransferase regulatory subunit [Candidatus Acidoferrales bacterium]
MTDDQLTKEEWGGFRAINGTRDITPHDSGLWNWFERTARSVLESYNFREIRTPVIEPVRLFERSVGSETDIVAKELFAWVDSRDANRAIRRLRYQIKVTGSKPSEGDAATRDFLLSLADEKAFDALPLANRLVLRPEGTASIARAYIEHGMQTLPGNQKLYYMGPMFRRERPQKGRYRQFYQIGAEVLGPSDAPAIDAEVIEMLLVFFKRVGLDRTTLYVNSIGCKECRPK